MINEGPVWWWWWWSCAVLSLSPLSLFSQFIPSISTNDPSSASCHSKTLNQYIATSKHAVLLQPFIKRHLCTTTDDTNGKYYQEIISSGVPAAVPGSKQCRYGGLGWAGLAWAGLAGLGWAGWARLGWLGWAGR